MMAFWSVGLGCVAILVVVIFGVVLEWPLPGCSTEQLTPTCDVEDAGRLENLSLQLYKHLFSLGCYYRHRQQTSQPGRFAQCFRSWYTVINWQELESAKSGCQIRVPYRVRMITIGLSSTVSLHVWILSFTSPSHAAECLSVTVSAMHLTASTYSCSNFITVSTRHFRPAQCLPASPLRGSHT